MASGNQRHTSLSLPTALTIRTLCSEPWQVFACCELKFACLFICFLFSFLVARFCCKCKSQMCVMCSTALAEHFKACNITPEAWYFNTDGAPSHFKNRFTMQSLFKFKTRSGDTTVVWENCAPGHGKGPSDGIGAVVKRFCRRMERENKVYANGARDVFCLLLDSFQKDKVGSRVAIDAFVFHYILSPSEPTLSGENVWSPIIRPSARPTVTSITGIRSSFCFRVAGANVLAVRELSCRCRCCLEHRWTDCKNADAGSWRRVTMTCSEVTGINNMPLTFRRIH